MRDDIGRPLDQDALLAHLKETTSVFCRFCHLPITALRIGLPRATRIHYNKCLERTCGKNVFPANPEWGVFCNLDKGHTDTVCVRFDNGPYEAATE